MIFCPPAWLEYGDVVGFNWNGRAVAGEIVDLGYHRYKFYLGWEISVRELHGEVTTGVIRSDGYVALFAMTDANNPARTRNNRELWESLGIVERDAAFDFDKKGLLNGSGSNVI